MTGVRVGSVFFRAAHLLAASAVAGAVLLDVTDPRVRTWWIASAVTGALLLVAEVVRHPTLFRELAGASTVLKLVLLGAVFLAPAIAPALLSAAFVVAVLGSHLPRGFRHRRIL